jgi:hypothetical protein
MSPKILNILLAALIVVLYMFVIDPLYSGTGTLWVPEASLSNLKTLDGQYDATLAQISTVQDGVNSLAKDYSKITDADKEKVSTMLSDRIDEVKLRNEVIHIANGAGVAIDNLDVQKGRVAFKGYQYYIVSFGLQSRYIPFKKLMEAYDRNLRFYNLDNIGLTRKKEDSAALDPTKALTDKDMLSIQVNFRVYQMK